MKMMNWAEKNCVGYFGAVTTLHVWKNLLVLTFEEATAVKKDYPTFSVIIQKKTRKVYFRIYVLWIDFSCRNMTAGFYACFLLYVPLVIYFTQK